ncbi:hypothetical protein HCN44_010498 [Aphidius gifuensis]|uniref:Uncharacterized protein n=1 Tax=Aphidius gifuensis TaxID=684658 RepID=A0A835CPX6_APHGI|nr:hypothetical protein HCN44_010498 [Aphidius gifuensis]
MAKFLALLVIALVYVIVNVQSQATSKKPVIGQSFDEITVSSDLHVKKRTKQHRQDKKLTNVPTGTTGSSGKTTEIASRLVSISDGSTFVLDKKRQRRETTKKRYIFHIYN